MREVERTGFVDATPAELDRHLSPRRVIEHEGTFSVVDTDRTGEETRVSARGGGMQVVFAFEQRTDGLDYRQVGAEGPFETMSTTLTYESERHGSEVTVRSTVGLGLPLAAITDRVAVWNRRGELDRLLDGLADGVVAADA